MIKQRISHSLELQLLFGVLLSLATACVVFFVLFFSGNQLLDRTIYGGPFMEKMANRRFHALEKYISEKNISTDEMNQLNAWCRRGERIYLAIYEKDQLIFSFPAVGDWDTDETMPDTAGEDTEHARELALADGTLTQAYLYYYPGDAFYFWMIVLSGAGAFLVFTTCFISLVRRKLRYVRQLKEELDILAGGELEHTVSIRGKDELGELAFGIDQMRRSILAHQAVEEEIRSSNSRLVAAMSHDLRTPLTSLLAYLELLDREKYDDQEQRKRFVKRSLGQAMRIKTMADQLFEYFLVYSTESEQPDLEPAEADALFQQILGEYVFSLESQGYEVQTSLDSLQGTVSVNTEMLSRVFDNLYSNLLKYADKTAPVSLVLKQEERQICLMVTNRISSERSERESTNLGLNTCRRIMRCHNGSFETREQEGSFQVTVRLPMKEEV